MGSTDRLAQIVLGGTVFVLVVAAWMFRYEVTPHKFGGYVYHNRWTGSVTLCRFGECWDATKSELSREAAFVDDRVREIENDPKLLAKDKALFVETTRKI